MLRFECCVELFCKEAKHYKVPSPFSKQGKYSYKHKDNGLKPSDLGELTNYD